MFERRWGSSRVLGVNVTQFCDNGEEGVWPKFPGVGPYCGDLPHGHDTAWDLPSSRRND